MGKGMNYRRGTPRGAEAAEPKRQAFQLGDWATRKHSGPVRTLADMSPEERERVLASVAPPRRHSSGS